MSTLSRSEEKIRLEDLQHYDQEDIGSYCSLSGAERAESPLGGGRGQVMEQEKRIRREIANSNERRRMQSINAGFQSLRTLLPHHEGEKLSKAAILQQTAEYIYQLEQEKTRLLSQNCQLKRLINQHEGEASSALKKRKTDAGVVVSMTPNESSDEGAGILSPEPIAIVAAGGGVNANGGSSPTIITGMDVENPTAPNSADLIELRVQLDRERGLRMILEDQVRSLETQLYPERIREITQQVQLQYQQRDEEEIQPAVITPIRRESGSSTGSESAGPASVVLTQQQQQQQQETAAAVATLQVVSAASLQPVSHTETVIATVNASPPASPSPSASASPAPVPTSNASRLTSILEAAIKAEPKVEVERLPSPNSPTGDELTQARVYLASTSRQNLETIVEAIRHLEGDALFSEGGNGDASSNGPGARSAGQRPRLTIQSAAAAASVMSPQDAPLALTKPTAATTPRLLKVEMNPFLQFNPPPRATPLQHQRPGVIVVKQHT